MATKNYYTISVGNKEPRKILQGHLNKTNGQPGPDAEEVSVEVGAEILPNFSRVWARRVIEGKDKKDVSVNDREYTGKLEYLKWGDPRGHMIEIRWLKNSNTLDKAFQEQREKLWWADDQAMLTIQRGKNYFDADTEAKKVEMLKHHTLNLDSPSRDPESREWVYREMKDEKFNGQAVTQIMEHRRATDIVMEANTSGGLNQLAAMFAGHPYNLDVKAPDAFIFEELLVIASKKTKLFLEQYNKVVRDTSDMLNKALEVGVIEIDTPGVISWYNNEKKGILLKDINGEGAGMITFLLENMLRPEIAAAIEKVDAATKKFVTQEA